MIQFIQLITMIVNDKSPIVNKVLPKNFLSFVKFPLIYDFLNDLKFVYTILSAVPVTFFLVFLVYLFFRIYNLSEKKHKEYGSIKRFFGISMYLIDTVLVIPIFGVCFKMTICGDNLILPSCTSSIYFVSILVSIFLILGYFFL